MLKTIQSVLLLLKTFLGGEYFINFALLLLIINAVSFIFSLIYQIIKKVTAHKTFNFINYFLVFVATIVLACELEISKKFVTSFLDVFIYLSIFTLIIKIQLFILKKTYRPKRKSPPFDDNLPKPNDFECDETPLKNDLVKKAVERLASGGENTLLRTGYLNVSHLKSLIEQVKQKPLLNEEERTLEAVEVNLLNFASRQPTPDERIVLSEQIGSLVKLIAKYE